MTEDERIEAIKSDLLALCRKHKIAIFAHHKYDPEISIQDAANIDNDTDLPELFHITWVDPKQIHD